MTSRNPLTRISVPALCLAAALLSAGLAAPDPLGHARAAPEPAVTPLVPLSGARSGGLTGPGPPVAPPGGSQLPPTGVPDAVRRLAARVVRRAASARSPVAGAFNWGQDGARFGASRGGRSHDGQDVFALAGTPLLAVRDAVVIEEGEGGGRGNYVALYDPPARRTYVYLHLQRRAAVRAGEHVRAGRRIGDVGCTGSCFGDHLHFEIRRGRGANRPPLDPLPDLRRWAQADRVRPTLPPGAH